MDVSKAATMSARPTIFASSLEIGHLCTVKGTHCQRVWQRSSTMSTICLDGPRQSVQHNLRRSTFRQRRPASNSVLVNSFLGRSLRQPHRPEIQSKDSYMKTAQRRSQTIKASIGPELGSADFDVVGALGLDTLTFLAATVIVVPTFRSFKISPVRIPSRM